MSSDCPFQTFCFIFKSSVFRWNWMVYTVRGIMFNDGAPWFVWFYRLLGHHQYGLWTNRATNIICIWESLVKRLVVNRNSNVKNGIFITWTCLQIRRFSNKQRNSTRILRENKIHREMDWIAIVANGNSSNNNRI